MALHNTQNGSTCLMHASARGNTDIVDLLLKNGANSEVQNKVLALCLIIEGWCYITCYLPYSLDQTPLLISRRSRIVAAPPEVLNEIIATLE